MLSSHCAPGELPWTVPCMLLQLRPMHTAQRPQKSALRYNASYLAGVRYVVCVGKSSRRVKN